jgi:hypothetical protein
MHPSSVYRYIPPEVAMILRIIFVRLTAGPAKPRTLIWKGKRRKARDIPADVVVDEIAEETAGDKSPVFLSARIMFKYTTYFILSYIVSSVSIIARVLAVYMRVHAGKTGRHKFNGLH